MKQQIDLKRLEKIFIVGDWVFLRLQPYKQSSMKLSNKQKLAPCFFGHYQVIENFGEVAYKLILPLGSKIHNVFHVSCLKKKMGENITPQTIVPKLDE